MFLYNKSVERHYKSKRGLIIMSMDYWGVVMHGVRESALTLTDEFEDGLNGVAEEKYNSNRDFLVKLPNGKELYLGLEVSEDDSFLGFSAGYPWEERMQGLTEKDVNDAIVQFLRPYVDMTDDEIRAEIEDISTYNCC